MNAVTQTPVPAPAAATRRVTMAVPTASSIGADQLRLNRPASSPGPASGEISAAKRAIWGGGFMAAGLGGIVLVCRAMSAWAPGPFGLALTAYMTAFGVGMMAISNALNPAKPTQTIQRQEPVAKAGDVVGGIVAVAVVAGLSLGFIISVASFL